jgi:hypothetical protein
LPAVILAGYEGTKEEGGAFVVMVLIFNFRHYWSFEKLPFQNTVSVHLSAACFVYTDAERPGEIPGQTGGGRSS